MNIQNNLRKYGGYFANFSHKFNHINLINAINSPKTSEEKIILSLIFKICPKITVIKKLGTKNKGLFSKLIFLIFFIFSEVNIEKNMIAKPMTKGISSEFSTKNRPKNTPKKQNIYDIKFLLLFFLKILYNLVLNILYRSEAMFKRGIFLSGLLLFSSSTAYAVTSDNDPSKVVPRPGGDAVTVIPKVCRGLSNLGEALAIGTLATILSRNFKIGTQVGWTVAGGLVGDGLPTKYICTWQYRVYNDADKRWHLYQTLVNYKDGTYKTPVRTSYYRLGYY